MGNVKDTAEAIQGIAKAVPVYQDLLQPAVKELGKGIHTLSKTVHIALSPVSALVWGYDHIKEIVQTSLEQKLSNIKKENIIPPAPEIAVPTIEALRYTGYNEKLRELFMNLLATSMDVSTANLAHPSFVESLKQLSSDEARILGYIEGTTMRNYPQISLRYSSKDDSGFKTAINHFSLVPYQSNCQYPNNGPAYIENLERLGILTILDDTFLADESLYNNLTDHMTIVNLLNEIQAKNLVSKVNKGVFRLTNYGELFYQACVVSKDIETI